MELQGINSIFGFLILILNVFRINAQILPEPLVQHNNRSSVCYGQGTHGQFRPSCPDNESVIAVQELRVGTKPIEANCPVSVTKWTNHTGSYIVDHLDFSKILDESSCCLPDESQDCTFVYSYLNSGLDYEYHIYSSGYSESKPDMEVSWGKTSCNYTNYPIGTNYMYMDYSCIKRTNIRDMCSNSIYTTVDGVLYLYNTNYPNSVKATIKSCQCDIQSDATNIQIYSIDIRLETDGHECKQAINLTDSVGTTYFDCESAPVFNVTKWSKNREVTLIFSNNLRVNGGYVWIGVSGARGDTIHCTYQDKQDAVHSSTPAHSTTSKQGLTDGNGSTTAQRSSVGHASTKDTTTEQESTSTTGGTISRHESVVSERTSSSYESTQSQMIINTESTIFTEVSTSSQPLTSTTVKTTLSTFEMSSSTETSTTDAKTSQKEPISMTEGHSTVSFDSTSSTSASESTDTVNESSEPTSEETHTRSIAITPKPQEMSDHYTIVVKDSQGTPILVLIGICAFMVILLIVMLALWTKRGYPCRTNRQIGIEPGDASGIQNSTNTSCGRKTHGAATHIPGKKIIEESQHDLLSIEDEINENKTNSTAASISPPASYLRVSCSSGESVAVKISPTSSYLHVSGSSVESEAVKEKKINNISPTASYLCVSGSSVESEAVKEKKINNTIGASESSNPGQCCLSDSTLRNDIIHESGNEVEGNAEVKNADNTIQCEQGYDKNITPRGRKRANTRILEPIVLPTRFKEHNQVNERSESKTAKQKSTKRADSPNKWKKRKRNRSKSKRKK